MSFFVASFSSVNSRCFRRRGLQISNLQVNGICIIKLIVCPNFSSANVVRLYQILNFLIPSFWLSLLKIMSCHLIPPPCWRIYSKLPDLIYLFCFYCRNKNVSASQNRVEIKKQRGRTLATSNVCQIIQKVEICLINLNDIALSSTQQINQCAIKLMSTFSNYIDFSRVMYFGMFS